MISQEVSSTNASQLDKIGGIQAPPWILKPFPFKPCYPIFTMPLKALPILSGH